MSQQHNTFTIEQEGRIELALQAYQNREFQSLRRAAATFNVPHATIVKDSMESPPNAIPT